MISAAGIVENFVAHEYPTEKVRKLLDINVMGQLYPSQTKEITDVQGSWFCALEAAKRMPEGGSIILIGSMSGSVSASDYVSIHLLMRLRLSTYPNHRPRITSPVSFH
jgi:NAD(P)-dependent dehydrogenase (short-subunit alcohol dehydrogenase family)